MQTHRQMIEQADGTWLVWCALHGKRHTKTVVGSKAEAQVWWQTHSGTPKAWCPQRTMPAAPNPFE